MRSIEHVLNEYQRKKIPCFPLFNSNFLSSQEIFAAIRRFFQVLSRICDSISFYFCLFEYSPHQLLKSNRFFLMMLMMMMMVMVMTIYCIKSVAISLQSRDYIDWVRWRLSRLFDDYFHSFLSQATRFSFVKSNSHYDFRKSILIIQEYYAELHLIASYHQRKRSISNPFQYKVHTELDSPQCRLKAYLVQSLWRYNTYLIQCRHGIEIVFGYVI